METPPALSSAPPVFRVLVIGGYGTFGGRLVELLAASPDLTIYVGGRSQTRAEAFCKRVTRPGGATLVPVIVDRQRLTTEILTSLQLTLVVDASGPFQSYDDDQDPYHVVRACISTSINYIDLADASEFVNNIDGLDDDARSAGVFALSGVSSFPVLTCAVVCALSGDLMELKSVTAGIAPSPYAGVGGNVIRAIASYSGKPIPVRRNGKNTTAYALTESMTCTITVPGMIPLKPTHFSLVDVPDLQLIPELWPNVGSVWVGAGPVPKILHRVLNRLATLVKWRLLPSINGLAPLMNVVMNHVRWGDHRGGMFIRIEGTNSLHEPQLRTWHLIAEGDDGPYIPSMAAQAIIRKCLAGTPPAKGARSAHADLELTDYDALFANRNIFTHTLARQHKGPAQPLYVQMLDDARNALPQPIQTLHTVIGTHHYSGQADVAGARGLIARTIAKLFGFPGSATGVPVNVCLTTNGKRETWERNFNGTRFHSTQEQGTGRMQGLIVERFGPFAFGLALIVKDNELHLELQRWTLLGIPMPRAIAPRSIAFETSRNGRFNFSVQIALPIIGQLVHYRGWLEPLTQK